jgi:hypothetical protein
MLHYCMLVLYSMIHPSDTGLITQEINTSILVIPVMVFSTHIHCCKIRLPIIIVIPVIVSSISIHCYKIRLHIVLEVCVIVFSIGIPCYEIMPEVWGWGDIWL